MNFKTFKLFFKIYISETFLYWCLKYNKNHPLLQILESEQLPKLKSQFSLSTTPNNEMKMIIEQQSDTRFAQPSLYQHSVSQNSISSEPTPTKKHSMSDISSVGSQSKINSNKKPLFLSKVSSVSQRESVSSVRSNSDEENRNKYILDEPINPKRPLRPKTQTSTTSGSNSTHNSRPVSHVSDDGTAQLSLLPINNNTSDLNFYNDRNNKDIDLIPCLSSTPPPPKPPKPANLAMIKKLRQQDSSTALDSSATSENDSILRN